MKKTLTYSAPHDKVKTDQPYWGLNLQRSDDNPNTLTTMLAVLVVRHRVTGRLYMGFYDKYFLEYCFTSTPPVGLTEAYDVTEGFPLDLCVPSSALQGNYRCMLDKTSKIFVKL